MFLVLWVFLRAGMPGKCCAPDPIPILHCFEMTEHNTQGGMFPLYMRKPDALRNKWVALDVNVDCREWA